MSEAAGLLYYGSNHPSIVGQASMLTAETVTTWGTGSAVPADATVHPILGIKAGNTGAALFVGHDYAELYIAGQISFEIETIAISETNVNTGSVGPGVADNTYILSHSVTGPASLYGRMWINTSDTIQFEAHTSDIHALIDAHSLDNGRFTKVTYSWRYDRVDVYYNGRLHGTSTRTNYLTDIFRYIYLGSNRGAASAGSNLTLQNYYVRNFLLSNQPVTLGHHPQLRNVYMFGDSFVTQAAVAGQVAYYRNNAEDVIKATFAKAGLFINLMIDGHDGATINDSSGNTLETHRAALIANDPDIVIFQAGANDAIPGGGVDAGFETDLDDHIDSILAGTTQTIILGNGTSLQYNSLYDDVQRVTQLAEVNALIAGAPARWDAANPLDPGRVVTYDLFNTFGGETPLDDMYNGQVSGAQDNFHPSAKGQKRMGELMVQTILNNIS